MINSSSFFKSKPNQEKVLTAKIEDDGLITLQTWTVLRPTPEEQIVEKDVEYKLKR